MSHSFRNKTQGFSIIELLVSIGIIFVISTIVLLNQSTYVDSASLSNLADGVASSVVQAQAYGIAVREVAPGSSDFSGSYGITMSLLGAGSNTAILFFVDRNSNQIYDGSWACTLGGSSECLEKTDILRGNYIDSFCVIDNSGSNQCNTIKRADISFLRPHLEAQIKLFNSGGASFNPPNMKGVKIVFKSQSGLSRSVMIYQNGQVSVQ